MNKFNLESIHQWLRKVENVSDKAINNTFTESNLGSKSTQRKNATSSNILSKNMNGQLSFFSENNRNIKNISTIDPCSGRPKLIFHLIIKSFSIKYLLITH